MRGNWRQFDCKKFRSATFVIARIKAMSIHHFTIAKSCLWTVLGFDNSLSIVKLRTVQQDFAFCFCLKKQARKKCLELQKNISQEVAIFPFIARTRTRRQFYFVPSLENLRKKTYRKKNYQRRICFFYRRENFCDKILRVFQRRFHLQT